MKKNIFDRKFKKTIKSFIKDEDGFVNKDQILKIGLGTIGSLGILSSLSSAHALSVTVSNDCCAIAHANFNNTAHQNGIVCTPVGSCSKCVMHNNAAAVSHVDHNAASALNITKGKGYVPEKGYTADLNINCKSTAPACTP